MVETPHRPFSWLLFTLKAVQNRPRLTIGIFVLIMGISLWGLKFSRLELDIYDVFDPHFSSSSDLATMKGDYQDQIQIIVTYHFEKTPLAGDICQILTWAQEIQRERDVKSVISPWLMRSPQSQGDKLWYPKVIEDPCLIAANSTYHFPDKLKESFFSHLIANSGSNDLAFEIAFKSQSFDIQLIQNLMNKTSSNQKRFTSKVKVNYLGPASFRYYFKKIIQNDSIYNILILILFLVFMKVFFGTWKSGFYLILTLTGTVIMLYGGMGLAGIPIDILTNNLFLMTSIAATADYIFVTQFQMQGNYQASLSKLIIPCFFTSLTTVVGFLSLLTSELKIIQHFGLTAAAGAAIEWAMLFLFLPAFLKIINKEEVWVDSTKAKQGNWLKKFESISFPKFILWPYFILMIAAVPAYFYLNDQDSPVQNFPENHPLRKAHESFVAAFNWQGQAYLYFPELPEPDQYVVILNKLSSLKNIYRFEDPEELANSWVKGLAPLRQELVKRELSMTPLWDKYYSRTGTLRIPLYLIQNDLHSLRKLRGELNAICLGRCRLAGQSTVYLEYGEKISKTLIESFAVSILLVIFILGYILKRIKKIRYFWPVVLSSLMGPLMILSFMAIFQIPVTLMTSIFLAIMVGLAGDNAIQYILVEDENLISAIDSRAVASAIITILMILGSSMFFFQTLMPMKILGILFVMGFAINLMGDLFGLKGLLTNLKN